MRKNFGPKTILYPQPVFIIGTYNEDGTPNAMNAAWGGIHARDEIAICVDLSHKTTKNFLARGAFTVSMADADHMTACDYLGIVSGNDMPDKVARAGFTAIKSDFCDAPLFAELSLALECKVVSYDEKTEILVGKILNVSADEKILDENGKVSPAKLRPITFDAMNNDYLVIGEKVGNAFADGVKLK